MRRAARSFAISSKKSLWMSQKNDRRGAKSSTFEPARDAALDVGEAVGEGERELLRRRRTRLANVVARDRDRIPAWRMHGAPLETVDDESQRRLDRIDPRVLGHVLLQDVVLDRSLKLRCIDALLLRRRDVETVEDDRGAVDRHRRRDLVERNSLEQRLHVGEARDRDAAFPDLAFGARMIGVVAHERREVERHRESRLPVLEQELVARVRVVRAPESGELAHRPQTAAIARGVNPARIRKCARAATCPYRWPCRAAVNKRGTSPPEFTNARSRVAARREPCAPLGDFGAQPRELLFLRALCVDLRIECRHATSLSLFVERECERSVATCATSASEAASGVVRPFSTSGSIASSFATSDRSFQMRSCNARSTPSTTRSRSRARRRDNSVPLLSR